MNDKQTTIAEVKEKILDFARQRGWGAGHTALNLAVSIAARVGTKTSAIRLHTNVTITSTRSSFASF